MPMMAFGLSEQQKRGQPDRRRRVASQRLGDHLLPRQLGSWRMMFRRKSWLLIIQKLPGKLLGARRATVS